jgi:hypothetical protein
MSRRLSAQGCTQVHRRDLSNNPTACGPCGQPSHLTRNTVASRPYSSDSLSLPNRLRRLPSPTHSSRRSRGHAAFTAL